jgi:polyhydroxyalkanoate synthase
MNVRDVVPLTPAQEPASAAGVREPGSSPWLGRRRAATDTFTHYQGIERAMQSLWPGLSALPISPSTVLGAYSDWSQHLAASPAKQWELADIAMQHAMRWVRAATAGPADVCWCIEPLPQDKRFDDPAWRERPYVWYAQALLLQQMWWQHATTGVPGVSQHHERMVDFAARQWLDMVSPSNSVFLNPVVIRRTLEEGGANLARGAMHAVGDAWREANKLPPVGADDYRVGIDVAATPGRVVVRNRLMELIQYTPTTPQAHAEPVLFVPAWIMKYYVLDLEARNSMVKFLVDAGFTVFMISWKNPTPEDRDLALDDYHRLGVRAALEAIALAKPSQPVHAVGYCLGGTLLAMVAALLAREKSHVLKTITLLAAQVDFTDPGEMSLFIDESQVSWFENQMAIRGVLDKGQMRGTFQMLRSRDLVWSYRLATYLMGERAPVSALMAWNADGTHLPYRMHSEYLHALYIENALAHGEYRLGGVPISLADIHTPIFTVGAVQDHVAPWRSVFKLHQFTTADQTFVLTAGGHNVGIVNPPGSPKSSHRIRHWKHLDRLLTPDEWLAETHAVPGSWWTPWLGWLRRHSSGLEALPRQLPSLGKAPGTYVLQK